LIGDPMPKPHDLHHGIAMEVYEQHLVDPDARTVEAYRLAEGAYALAARASGDEALRAEPLPDLTIRLASLWP
jgi:hypothetical protein